MAVESCLKIQRREESRLMCWGAAVSAPKRNGDHWSKIRFPAGVINTPHTRFKVFKVDVSFLDKILRIKFVTSLKMAIGRCDILFVSAMFADK